jgi:3-deoxy-manno-octulosonate cytidylyltransferase (CMP-KDO synthetase)
MIVGIIPARYASTRFPGKPLTDILGKTMIQRVYEQSSQSKMLEKVVVATDDQRIYEEVRSFGGNVVMTGSHHQTGTERCLETLHLVEGKYKYVINIQGDEPLIDPQQIDELALALKDETIELATQMIKVTDQELLFNPSEVKIVVNENMEALYFSRMPIPYLKEWSQKEWHQHHTFYRHAGMYAYRTDILEKIAKLPVSSLEKAESLEQLRWLENGYKIKCVITNFESLCVDSPRDVEAIVDRLKKE